MKALVYDAKEDLFVSEYSDPIPKSGEVVVKIKWAGICGSDMLAWNGGFKRITKPVVLGHEFIGEIVEIASEEDKDKFKIGQRVAVEPLLSCGRCEACRTGNYHVCRNLKILGLDRDGGMAAYAAVPSHCLHPLPEGITWEKAALCEPIAVAVHMVRRTGLKIGDKVAIFGAGPIGLSLGMVAKKAGASKIVLTEINDFRINLARELEFEVVDAKKDPTDALMSIFGEEGADVSFEASATVETLNTALRVTKIRGTILLGGVFKKPPSFDAQSSTLKEQAIIGTRVYNFLDFKTAIELLTHEDFKAEKLISRKISIDDAISKGFSAIKNGEEVMKILIGPN